MDFKFITMKKLILVSFLFISTVVYSQGNLQFNRVINLEYSQNLTYYLSNCYLLMVLFEFEDHKKIFS